MVCFHLLNVSVKCFSWSMMLQTHAVELQLSLTSVLASLTLLTVVEVWANAYSSSCKTTWYWIVCIFTDIVVLHIFEIKFMWIKFLSLFNSIFVYPVSVSLLCCCPLAGHCLRNAAVHPIWLISWLSLTNTTSWLATAACYRSTTTSATSKVTSLHKHKIKHLYEILFEWTKWTFFSHTFFCYICLLFWNQKKQ